MKKQFIKMIIIISFICFSSAAFTEDTANDVVKIYIDQKNGKNSSNTTGSEADPFKSITYAVLKNRDCLLPLYIYVKAGMYDANPTKEPNEREIFPIELRDHILIQGLDNAENCIISGTFNSNSKAAMMRGHNLSHFSINNLTFRDMNRSEGNGGALELINCSGNIENCIFKNNRAQFGGGINISENFTGNISNNTFNDNWAETDGGAFCIWKNFSGDLNNNTFSGNIAEKQEGGAFHIEKNMKGNLINNSFNNNIADNHGGGFSVWGYFEGNIINNVFSNNKVKDNCCSGGGAFYINSRLTGDILDNKFNGNSSVVNAGAYRVNGTLTGNVSNNSFRGNSAKYNGGGFYVNALIGNISNNIFTNNSSNYDNGGAFYIKYDIKGSIYSNSFNENSAYDFGGSFYIDANLLGDVSENIFSRNSAETYEAGCFYVEKNMTGDITNNSFVENSGKYGKAFRISGFLEGRIDSNLFSQYNSFYIATNNDPILVSNNYFLYIRNISSKQNLFVFNNSFINSGVNIWNSANKSEISNNIFFKSNHAIWIEGELNLLIKNNDFYNATNILHRNNQAMGADSFFIEMLLPETFINNKDFLPGFVGEDLETGIWTENLVYDSENNFTVFTDTSKNWQNGQWVDCMINLSNSLTERRQHYLISGNTATQIKVKGYIVSSNIGQEDHIYSIDDYRLNSNSNNIDAGIINNIIYDFEKEWRPQGGYYDIGADEFFQGEMIPGIAHVNPPAKNITANTSTLQSQINPNEISSTCYFEYGTNTTYGLTTSVLSGYTGSGLFLINSEITELLPDTEYHFRLVATNSTGTAYGSDQFFKTKPITANLNGKVSFALAGHTGLVVKNAIIKLEDTEYVSTTNELGEFTFKNIPASNYKLIISADNLIPIEYQVNLSEGQNLDIGVKEMFVPSSEGIEETIHNAVTLERMRWDSNGDNKKGIPEAIDALQEVVGIK